MKSTRIRIGLKGKTQFPLLMIIKEYYDDNGDVKFAKILFELWLPGKRNSYVK